MWKNNSLLSTTLMITITALLSLNVLAAPQVVMTETRSNDQLNAHERYLLSKLAWEDMLKERIHHSRSLVFLTRDPGQVRVILEQRQLADSSLGKAVDDDQYKLDAADVFLEPVIRQFQVFTEYVPMELIEGAYERRDSVRIELGINAFDGNGVTKFTLNSDVETFNLPSIEASEEQKGRGLFRNPELLRSAMTDVVDEFVTSLVERVNPITVLDVQKNYFIIDRGANNGFTVGSRFDVYSASRTVEHPRTGELRQLPGAFLGTAEITKVLEDLTEAKMQSPADAKVEIGALLRNQEKN